MKKNKTTEHREFLISAINNITQFIQLSDTKISIVMAANIGIIAIFLSSFSAPHINQSLLYYIFYLMMVLFIVFWGLSMLFSVLSIKSRISKCSYKSNWFFSTNEFDYLTKFEEIYRMNSKEIIKNLSVELYKLNRIHMQKIIILS